MGVPVEAGWVAREAMEGEAQQALQKAPGVRWTAAVGEAAEGCGLSASGDEIVLAAGGQIWRVGRTGEVRASFPQEGLVGLAAGDGGSWVTSRDGVLRLSPEGKVLWNTPLQVGQLEAEPALGQLDGDLALEGAVSGSAGVAWLDDDGRVLGQRRGESTPTPAPLVANGEVFAVRGGWLEAHGPKERRWAVAATGAKTAPPILADTDRDGEPEVLAADSHGVVLAVDLARGTLDWLVQVDHPPMPYGELWREWFAGPAVWDPAQRCLLAATWEDDLDDQALYCLDQGGPRWRHALPTIGSRSGVALGEVDGRRGEEAVLGTDSGEVRAVNQRGDLVWRWQGEGPIRCRPLVLDLDGDGRPEVLVATASGLVALSPARRP